MFYKWYGKWCLRHRKPMLHKTNQYVVKVSLIPANKRDDETPAYELTIHTRIAVDNVLKWKYTKYEYDPGTSNYVQTVSGFYPQYFRR